MDRTDPSNLPSAIPRPSRLPVLSKRPMQQFGPPYREQEKVSSKGLKLIERPKLSNKSSTTSLRSVNKESAPTPVAQPTKRPVNSVRPGLTSGSRGNLRSSTPKAPSLSGLRTRRPTSEQPLSDDVENFDQLGSLDIFRAASRQGLVHDAEPDDYVETLLHEPLQMQKERKSRPSLSDRTIGSLQAVPKTPKDRRDSNFFGAVESPMLPPARPGSSLSHSTGANSRPNTSDGTFAKPALPSAKKVSMSAKTISRTSVGGDRPSNIQSGMRGASNSFTSRLQSARQSASQTVRAPSPSKRPANGSLMSKPSKTRLSANGMFAEPLTEGSRALTEPAKVTSKPTSTSSAALRQQIAAAKAAAKQEREKSIHDSPMQSDQGEQDVGFEMNADPFNQAPNEGKHSLRNRINAARMDGKLNISALRLKTIPDEVLSMYSAAAMEESKVNWAEVVDMTRLIAADNELETIPDLVFPDIAVEELQEDDEGHGNQFGGLEGLDLHGNSLNCVPVGLRRLERLTTLNLTHNKIDNGSLDIIAQIKSLRELKLGHNSISGTLSASICSLSSLEVLDLQANRLLALPEAVRELVGLRVLNVSGNQLTSLPMDALVQLPLQEIDVGSNALIASLFPLGGPNGHRTLRTLNVANNSLAALTFASTLDMPELQTLDVTNNHLAVLPPVQGWIKLITLTAGDNKIAELSESFTNLPHLRNANFSGNELRLLPAEISRMESLDSLILAGNPLRNRKYLSMGATDIKRDLGGLLEPSNHTEGTADRENDVKGADGTSPEDSTSGTSWTLHPNGLLDLSNRGLTDSVNDSLGSFLKANEVRQLNLQGNKLKTVPPALWLGQHLRSLDLSDNPLEADYFSDDLDLPSLADLRLSKCRIAALGPLIEHLHAPALQSLQLFANRLSGALPQLRQHYPNLHTLLAGDNKFSSISVDALRAFTTVDLASNEIQALPAQVGLLWDAGLKHLEIGRNAFRVPGYRVLEKGTEATMRWLRDRIPDAHGEVTDQALLDVD